MSKINETCSTCRHWFKMKGVMVCNCKENYKIVNDKRTATDADDSCNNYKAKL